MNLMQIIENNAIIKNVMKLGSVLMQKIAGVILVFLGLSFFASVLMATQERNYFQFDVLNYHTTRQSGQTLNVYIRYRYKQASDHPVYFDYRPMRTLAISYLEPTVDYPKEVYWEDIAIAMGRELVKKFPIEAISIQLDVEDNPTHQEPGNHGPAYTYGDIEPLPIYHQYHPSR